MGSPSAFALLGCPVHHSPSPDLHNAWMRHYGLSAQYTAVECTADAESLEALLRRGTYAGVNLTTPLKETLIGRLDTLDEGARASRAVNTVVHRQGKLHGYNTDIGGFLDALTPSWHTPWCETDALILGAGGAARAVAVAAGAQGARSVQVLNRTANRARALVAEMRPTFPATRWVHAPHLEALTAHPMNSTPLVIDATSGAHSPWAHPSLLRPGHLWMDLSYWRDLSNWTELSQTHGVTLIDGTSMLLHQAARAFHHFTGVSPDLTIARRVLDELQSIQDSLD